MNLYQASFRRKKSAWRSPWNGSRDAQKCCHQSLWRTSSTGTVCQMWGGKQGELPIFLLGGQEACNEIPPGDVQRLGNKTCITFSRDQSTAVTHGHIGSECVSKL
jgi:hypothetical protein